MYLFSWDVLFITLMMCCQDLLSVIKWKAVLILSWKTTAVKVLCNQPSWYFIVIHWCFFGTCIPARVWYVTRLCWLEYIMYCVCVFIPPAMVVEYICTRLCISSQHIAFTCAEPRFLAMKFPRWLIIDCV